MFTVRWVAYGHEGDSIESEVFRDIHADVIIEACKLRLPSMRLQFAGAPPDGFLVFDSGGKQVRRWFGSKRPID
jgi:hypothetical protein